MTLVTMAINKKVVYNLNHHVGYDRSRLGKQSNTWRILLHISRRVTRFFCVIIKKKSYKRMVRAAKDFSSVKIMFKCII